MIHIKNFWFGIQMLILYTTKLMISFFQYKLSLISIIENKHKNKWQISISELTLSGYDLYLMI